MIEIISKSSLTTIIGMVLVGTFVVVSALAPVIAPYDPYKQNYDETLEPPSAKHPFGTDDLGRDLLSRVIFGARVDLVVVLIVVGLSGTFGTILGTIAGLSGGLLDDLIMRITDIFMSIPYLVLAMAVAAALKPGLQSIIIAMMFAWWRGYTRIARGEAISIREESYIEAARAIGVSRVRLIFVHVIRNQIAPILVYGTLDMGSAILTVAALSFLGYGVQPPIPEWGVLVVRGRDYLTNQWWLTILPGLAIFSTVWGFNLLGDQLRDILDPKTQSRIR